MVSFQIMAFYHFYSKALHHRSSSNKADNYEEMTDVDAEIVVPLLDDFNRDVG